MDPFIGEIRIFAGNFPPTGWAFCNGQLLSIAQNTALFSLLGTNYGGDGKTNFALPNLQAAAPLGAGQGPGLSPRNLGDHGGTATVSLTQNQIAAHSHPARCASTAGGTISPAGAVFAPPSAARALKAYNKTGGKGVAMSTILPNNSTTQPHNNMSPYLGLSFIIALQGIYPARP